MAPHTSRLHSDAIPVNEKMYTVSIQTTGCKIDNKDVWKILLTCAVLLLIWNSPEFILLHLIGNIFSCSILAVAIPAVMNEKSFSIKPNYKLYNREQFCLGNITHLWLFSPFLCLICHIPHLYFTSVERYSVSFHNIRAVNITVVINNNNKIILKKQSILNFRLCN